MKKQQKRLLEYLAAKPEAILDFPFDESTQVFKVCGKMFALFSEKSGQGRINLKCDPFHAQELRSIFAAVEPGYHMNKKHWNSVWLDDSLPDGELLRMVDHSYALVVKGLTKKDRTRLELSYGKEQLYGTFSD